MKKVSRDEAREQVWHELRKVAKPDSRFSYNFAECIADYEGSELSADLIRNHEVYKNSQMVFITPDNNLEKLREYVMLDRKVLLMTNYGISRGFCVIRPGDVPAGKEELAATLDGFEKFMQLISLEDVKEEFNKVDMLVTGGSAISRGGFRFGKGHGYFDLEWAMFWEYKLVNLETPVLAVGHDCQIVDIEIEPSSYDTIIDYIVTPNEMLEIKSDFPKPTAGVIWEKLQDHMIESIPPLKELYEKKISNK